MKLPDVIHPKRFSVNGYTIGVATYFPISDQQAAKIALMTLRSRRWTKKDQKKVHLQYWTGDKEALALLG